MPRAKRDWALHRARNRAKKLNLTTDDLLKDILDLLDDSCVIEHDKDYEMLKRLRQKYGWKLW